MQFSSGASIFLCLFELERSCREKKSGLAKRQVMKTPYNILWKKSFNVYMEVFALKEGQLSPNIGFIFTSADTLICYSYSHVQTLTHLQLLLWFRWLVCCLDSGAVKMQCISNKVCVMDAVSTLGGREEKEKEIKVAYYTTILWTFPLRAILCLNPIIFQEMNIYIQFVESALFQAC